jgi:hypothetical protein
MRDIEIDVTLPALEIPARILNEIARCLEATERVIGMCNAAATT